MAHGLHVLRLFEVAIRAAIPEVGPALHPHVHRVAVGVQGAGGGVVGFVHAGRDPHPAAIDMNGIFMESYRISPNGYDGLYSNQLYNYTRSSTTVEYWSWYIMMMYIKGRSDTPMPLRFNDPRTFIGGLDYPTSKAWDELRIKWPWQVTW